jgi:hypothetical protein
LTVKVNALCGIAHTHKVLNSKVLDMDHAIG